jgi:hypothetical protein
MGDLVKDLLLVGIKGEERQVLGVEEAEDVFVQIEKDLVEIAGGVDLTGDPLDVLRKLDFLLQFMQVLGRRFGLHLSSPMLDRRMFLT